MSRAWYQTPSISCIGSCARAWIPLMLNPITSHLPHNAPSVSEAGLTSNFMSGDLPMQLICASVCCKYVCWLIALLKKIIRCQWAVEVDIPSACTLGPLTRKLMT